MVPQTFLHRALPDGGRQLVLDDPVLRALVLDGGVTLRFGWTEVVVAGPCTLRVDGVDHRLDPGQPPSLAPLLTCHPGAVGWLWVTPEERLVAAFMQGQRLEVPGPPGRRSWSVVDGPPSVGRSDEGPPRDGPPWDGPSASGGGPVAPGPGSAPGLIGPVLDR